MNSEINGQRYYRSTIRATSFRSGLSRGEEGCKTCSSPSPWPEMSEKAGRGKAREKREEGRRCPSEPKVRVACDA